MGDKYRIAVFAHNEENGIQKTINSILCSFTDNEDFVITVLANGCTDSTVEIVRSMQQTCSQIVLREIQIGDKCNAWNEYVYSVCDDVFCHWFCDADVTFSRGSFQLMLRKLKRYEESVAVAGVPLSGRGKNKYCEMIKKEGVIFGNLYAVKSSFLAKVRDENFKLPVGFLVDDNLIGRIICTSIDRGNAPDFSRVVYDENAGYFVDSLNPFLFSDIRLYFNRLVRYRLGELQQEKLRPIPYSQFPEDLDDINRVIYSELANDPIPFRKFIDRGVVKRLEQKCR
ncbi:MAG: glycosyltransferase [Thermodesulfobacteriota bacterium]